MGVSMLNNDNNKVYVLNKKQHVNMLTFVKRNFVGD